MQTSLHGLAVLGRVRAGKDAQLVLVRGLDVAHNRPIGVHAVHTLRRYGSILPVVGTWHAACRHLSLHGRHLNCLVGSERGLIQERVIRCLGPSFNVSLCDLTFITLQIGRNFCDLAAWLGRIWLHCRRLRLYSGAKDGSPDHLCWLLGLACVAHWLVATDYATLVKLASHDRRLVVCAGL